MVLIFCIDIYNKLKIMKKREKTLNIYIANKLAEQRYLNSMLLNESEFGEKIKAFATSNIPKVKDASEVAVNKAKDGISKAYGFSVEQWNDPENQAKVKSLYEKLKDIIERITKAGWEVLSDPKKLSTLLTTLNIGSFLSIIKGVWDLIFVTSVDFSWISGVSTTVGGIFYFKLAIFLFAVRVVLGVIGGAITLGKVVSGMVGFIKDLINLFTSKKEPVAEPTTEPPEPPTGQPPVQQNNEPLQESLIRLFEMYGYEKNLI